MKIRNVTRKFSMECEVAKSMLKQGVGLAFSAKRRNMLFVFSRERCWEFWMFGMHYPIKIIFIDKNKRVTDIRAAVSLSFNPKTWKIYRPKERCKYVLELGKSADKKFEIGDKLEWKL